MRKIAILYFLLHLDASFAATCIFIEKASFVNNPIQQIEQLNNIKPDLYPRLLHQSHEIESGKGVVFIIREYEHEPQVSDSGKYTKITAVIPGFPVEKESIVNITSQNFRFSRGGSDWVHRGIGYFSEKVSGKMRFVREDALSITLWLDAQVEMRLAEDFSPASTIRLNSQYKLSSHELNGISPWLGQAVKLPKDLAKAWKPQSDIELSGALGKECH